MMLRWMNGARENSWIPFLHFGTLPARRFILLIAFA